jgi:cullin 4
MQTQLSSFTEWYSRKHSRHVLEWYHGLGNVTLIARFKHGEKNIEMSMYQALVLLLFADEDDLDFKHISKSTEIGNYPMNYLLSHLLKAILYRGQ